MIKTRQLDFWEGDFGDRYVERSQLSPHAVKARGEHMDKFLASSGVGRSVSVLEVGANVGMNLKGLRRCRWDGAFFAVEPNKRAFNILVKDKEVALEKAFNKDGFDLPFHKGTVDLVFTCGVLIHVHPENLLSICSEIFRVSRRYVLCMEYFSAEPVEIDYRGQQGLLFKCDFADCYLQHWTVSDHLFTIFGENCELF